MNPLVSIVCDVYNHGPFLRNALEGFIMQRVNFPIEIIIHDDASTDDSAEIIREYASNYPDLFRPIYEIENQYFKQNLWADIQFPRANGKYIALCEGDDCWTDPLKLQKQVDYMETHPECSLCFHNAFIHWTGEEKPDQLFAELENRDYSGEELCVNWISPTASFLFRSSLISDYIDLTRRQPKLVFGDRPLSLVCARRGTVHAFPEAMCIYTKHQGAYTQNFDATKIYKQAYSWECLRNHFGDTFHKALTHNMEYSYILAIKRGMTDKNVPILFKAFYRGILRHPRLALQSLFRIPKERRERKSKLNES